MRKATYYLVVFKGAGRAWYWRVTAPNGRKIADGAEGYSKRSGAVRAAKRFILVASTGMMEIKES
jgi:uncharacterized protein YegP (UPF0339 family)